MKNRTLSVLVIAISPMFFMGMRPMNADSGPGDDVPVASKRSINHQTTKAPTVDQHTEDSGSAPTLESVQNDPSQNVEPTEIAAPCVKAKGNAQLGLGGRRCEDFKRDLADKVKKNVGHIIANFYEGKVLALDDRPGRVFCVENKFSHPVCELGDNGDGETNIRGENCGGAAGSMDDNGGMCRFFDGKGFSFASCTKENSWQLGARVRAWRYYTDQVLSEVDTGKVQLVNFGTEDDPAHPCAPYALEVKHLLENPYGLVATESNVRNRIPAAQYSDVCDQEQAQAQADDGSGVLKNKQSFAACHLKVARQQLESIYSRFMTCEVLSRAKSSYYSMQTSADWNEKLHRNVVRNCADYASAEMPRFMSRFYHCYKDEVGGKTGARTYYKNYIQSRYPASDDEIEVKKLGESNRSCAE